MPQRIICLGKGAIPKRRYVKFNRYMEERIVTKTELVEMYNILLEENRLLKIEASSALRSQREQFEEMDKQIQELKESNEVLKYRIGSDNRVVTELISTLKVLQKRWEDSSNEIQELKKENENRKIYNSNLEAEISRLKGKMQECWNAARRYEVSVEKFYESGIVILSPNFEQWSKENNLHRWCL